MRKTGNSRTTKKRAKKKGPRAWRKIPPEAFAFYSELGPGGRTYGDVAEKYGVCYTAIAKVAGREKWRDRMRKAEERSRAKTDEKLVESLEEMNERHLAALRKVQTKALEALDALPLDSAIDAVRSIDMAIKQERVIRGEPGDRTAVSLETLIRQRHERWVEKVTDDDDDDGAGSIPDPDTAGLPAPPTGEDQP